MKQLLIVNIKKSFKILAEEHPKIPEHLIEIKKDESKENKFNLIELLARAISQPIPWFYYDKKNELQSPQQIIFGVYAFSNIIRNILISISFIQAGELLRTNDFIASSIMNYYTSAFHLLKSFLAINGRIIIEKVLGTLVLGPNWSEHKILDPPVEVIVAKLTKKNIWKFEPRKRAHYNRWKEIEPILLKNEENLYGLFIAFLKYILLYGSYTPSDDDEIIREGLKRLCDIRHESVYMGYGYDDYAFDRMINKESYGAGLDLKVEYYHNFVIGLLKYCVNETVNLQLMIPSEHWSKVQSFLASSIYSPQFEFGSPKINNDNELSEQLEIIYKWFINV